MEKEERLEAGGVIGVTVSVSLIPLCSARDLFIASPGSGPAKPKPGPHITIPDVHHPEPMSWRGHWEHCGREYPPADQTRECSAR